MNFEESTLPPYQIIDQDIILLNDSNGKTIIALLRNETGRTMREPMNTPRRSEVQRVQFACGVTLSNEYPMVAEAWKDQNQGWPENMHFITVVEGQDVMLGYIKRFLGQDVGELKPDDLMVTGAQVVEGMHRNAIRIDAEKVTGSEKYCSGCSKLAEKEKSWKPCAKCNSAWYCGRDCQNGHWKRHKKSCARLAAERAERLSGASSAGPVTRLV